MLHFVNIINATSIKQKTKYFNSKVNLIKKNKKTFIGRDLYRILQICTLYSATEMSQTITSLCETSISTDQVR